ncbi:DUF4347 domain-containing protein [Microseira wollei]|uniref:DUF4347 domain-containing protein n=1 Tax=Microseira wollei NIES-4236 TaxID=2530354 RepID=A0AAV3XSR1_9CYAN|nr:DUF4347 domain-containing protein [Microseira wollei]GET43525.1 hypothetical protein MiSe_83500 [Microseira wollei NIES-4236]
MNFNTTSAFAHSPTDDARSVVFIDPKVSDYQDLLSGVRSGVERYVLDPSQDAIAQITQILANHPEITSLHLIAHGIPGCLFLGNTQLCLDTLEDYAHQLQQWFKKPLGTRHSLHLYGCHVAAGDAGAEFIAKLHQLTGANIAASTTAVGNPALGGNWELDATLGEKVFLQPLPAETLASYPHILSEPLEYSWARGFGGSGDDDGYRIAVDREGNVYTTGVFQGTVDFDPGIGTYNLTSAGDTDIFISKLDRNGKFVWAQSYGDTGGDRGFGITVDSAGNVYATGHFQGTVDFDPSSSVQNLTRTGGTDAFISKLDSSGNLIWVKQYQGSGNSNPYEIKLDAAGNIYTTGQFNGSIDLDPGAGTANITALGSYWGDIWVSKLDSSGNFLWAQGIQGYGNEHPQRMTVDSAGNTYLTGAFFGTLDVSPGSNAPDFTASGVDSFLVKLDSSGNHVWSQQISRGAGDYAYGVAVDGAGNVYINGAIDTNSFISKFDSAGNALWTKDFPNSSGLGISLDSAGNIHTTGQFQGTVDFDPGSGVFNLTSNGGYDIFTLELDSNGNFLWATGAGGAGNDAAIDIDATQAGAIYTTGQFQNTASFGAGIDPITSQASFDIFVAKLGGLATVTLTAVDSTATESGNDTGTYRISRDNNISGDLLVKLNLSSSTDLNPSDYTLSGGNITINGTTATVVIPAGQSFVDLTLTASDDLPAEAAESLTLSLVADAAYNLGNVTTGTVTIAANDFVVTNTNDSREGSLRQAIVNANASAGANTITFGGSVFTDATPDVITLTTGQLTLSDNTTILGTGANNLTISGNNASRVLEINSGVTATLQDLTIANGNAGLAEGGGINNQGNLTLNNSSLNSNYAHTQGAAIWNNSILTVNNSKFQGNSTDTYNGPGGGGAGGGIFNSGGTVTVNNSTFTEAAVRDGGGIFNHNGGNLTVNSSTFSNSQSNGGGGIFNALGTATINNSTISGNRAYGWGAGLWNAPGSTMTLSNSTVSGNSSGVGGGGIWNEGGNLTVGNSTVTGNSAGYYGGGIWSNAVVNVSNSIVAGNSASLGAEVNNAGGSFTSLGYNLVGQNGNGGGFSTVATDIVLPGAIGTAIQPLANNGGPTQTHALVAGSPAVNAGNNVGAPATDQRGSSRIVGGNIDIGAVESSFKSTLTLTAIDDSATESGNNPGTYRISRGNDTGGNLTVNLNLSGSTDLNPSDYTLSGGSITINGTTATVVIPAGQSFVDLTLTASDDLPAEAAESLTLSLVADAAYNLGNVTTGTVTIAANDFVVTNTNDSREGSLRQAIVNANASAGANTITFGGSVFTDATPDVITLTTGQLTLSDNTTILGTGANNLTISGNNASRVFEINSGVTATLNDLTVTNGNGGAAAGGISNGGVLTLNRSALTGNQADRGGGIVNSGTLTLSNSTVNNNFARIKGGGIYNGITGVLTLSNSTLSGNSSVNDGGGIFNSSDFSTGGRVTVTNSTLTSNSSSTNGGGIWSSGRVTVSNSIWAGNSAPTGSEVFLYTSTGGTFTSSGYNLVGQNGNGGGFSTVATDIVLPGAIGTAIQPLANNGGPTQTHALVAGSPAMNAGNNALIPIGTTTDQRGTGFDRILGGTVDIGAVESLAQSGKGGNKTFPINQGSGTFTITDFTGVGKDNNPSTAIRAEADTIQFTGADLTADKMLLNQVGANLEITFEGVANTKVVLQNFALENLDNLTRATGANVDLANILFNGQTTPQESFDVVNANFTANSLSHRNSVTFLNELDNSVNGFNNSDDGINGQGGNDILNGLSGDDWLRGGAGSDTLIGGRDNDTLVGGQGADYFSFGVEGDVQPFKALGVDTITDLNLLEGDKIVLSKDTFRALTSPPGSGLVASDFNTVTSDLAAASSSARIVYNSSNGNLFYNPNGNASGFGVGGQFAQLSNAPQLNTSAFLVQV